MDGEVFALVLCVLCGLVSLFLVFVSGAVLSFLLVSVFFFSTSYVRCNKLSVFIFFSPCCLSDVSFECVLLMFFFFVRCDQSVFRSLL